MGWCSRLWRTERKYGTLDLFREVYGGTRSITGDTVTIDSALQVSAVLACVRVISQGVAQVPYGVFQRQNDGKVAAPEHPLHRLLAQEPAPGVTSFEFRETVAMHLALKANAYVWTPRVGSRREIRRLEPLSPNRVNVEDDRNGVRTFVYHAPDGQRIVFPEADIWHLRGPTWENRVGMETLKLARNAIGLAAATEQTHGDLHRNGMQVSGTYTVPDALSPEGFAELAAWLEKYERGGERAHKALILSNGAQFAANQMKGVDAQHLETRKFQIEEVCRSLGVIPLMAGYSDKTATYASAEQMFIAHAVHTLDPWYERISQSADINLFSPEDRAAGFHTRFNPRELMRGTAVDQAQYYATALGAGGQAAWMTQDEVREETGRNPRGGLADELSPGAMRGTDNGTPDGASD